MNDSKKENKIPEQLSKEAAASIVASRNFKIFMKLEDPQSTYDLFEKSVGEALPSDAVILDADKKL